VKLAAVSTNGIDAEAFGCGISDTEIAAEDSLALATLHKIYKMFDLWRAPMRLIDQRAKRKTMPAKDLNDLIDWLKANPDKASAGIATGVTT
jgi:hypothetical protein